jgi:hypothetical protein
MKEKRLPNPHNIQDIIFGRYKKSYKEDISWKNIVEQAKQKILAEKPNLKVTAPFILYMFGKPEIAVQFPTVSYLTVAAFGKAVSSRNPKHVQEAGFFLDEESNHIFATRNVQKPAAYDLPNPKTSTIEAPQRQTIAGVHTHPPFSRDPLKPSVYIVDNEGEESGDLFAFSEMHRHRKETMEKGERPCFVERPLSIILQSDIINGIEKLLFILESPEISNLKKEDYIKHLQDNKHLIDEASSEEEAVNALRRMGYKASMVKITSDQLYGQFPIIGIEFKKLLNELELPIPILSN